MLKSEDGQKKMELVNIQVKRDDVEKIISDQHKKFSKTELSDQFHYLMARNGIIGAKALLSLTSKEKARKASAKPMHDFIYAGTKAAAEKWGGPRDILNYLAFEEDWGQSMPSIPPRDVVERTKTRAQIGIKTCPFGDSIRALAKQYPDYIDKDVLEIAAARCERMDLARAEAWNPDMIFKEKSFVLNDLLNQGTPGDGCFFEFSLPE
jgi:hypothetical protein